MALLAVGLNHKTAPVQIRERVAFAPEQLPDTLRSLASQANISEAAILSTCNRTEMLCCVDTADSAVIIEWLREHREFSVNELDPYMYTHPEQSAVRHMLRVASGLDSLVLGEPQILGQLKDAYSTAKDAGTIGTQLSKLFEYTFSVAKQVRTDTAIGASPVSVAFSAVSLSKQIFSDLSEHTALLIGAGETIELAARHLKESGIKRLIIANRTLAKAEALVKEVEGYAITLGDIPAHLAEADIVISSTASQLPILGKGAVERAIKIRKHQPILMVDIAVPRDIEEEVGELDDVYLYTVDDLQEIIDEGLRSRQEAALQAEEIIDTQVTHFMGWLRSLDAVSTIRTYRSKIDVIREAELDKAKRMLAQGNDPEKVLTQLARGLTNKIVHTPSAQMKQAGFDGRADLLDAARELLDLDTPDN
ncbi:MAG: glutamyl-tRNA reductase [Thiotrichaceae bacterium]|nr:glutamyl-tRNA reductase [Thiotrichaceae bacterium]PCI11304.1 MAG: glutamyl-tRNA reductase [Thiotrichales bacterium]